MYCICFLMSLSLFTPATTAVFGSSLTSLYYDYNAQRGFILVSPNPYDWRGCVGAKNKTSVVCSVFNSLMVLGLYRNLYSTGFLYFYEIQIKNFFLPLWWAFIVKHISSTFQKNYICWIVFSDHHFNTVKYFMKNCQAIYPKRSARFVITSKGFFYQANIF